MNQKSYRNCLFRSFSCRMSVAVGEKPKDAMTFFKKSHCISKQNKTAFWGEMATNGKKTYFHVNENASSEQIYALLDNVERADEDDIEI